MTRRPVLRAVAGLALAGLLASCSVLLPQKPAQNGYAAPAGQGSGGSPGPVTGHPFSIGSLLDPASGKFLGVEASGAPDSLGPVTTFATSIGRKPNLIGQYVAWGAPFPARAASNAWSYAAVAYLAWEPFSPSVQAIASGRSDGYIKGFAAAVRALNLPVAISFGHEMNGNWYPWGTTRTTPAEFVAAWRHIHDLFAKAHASNVIWVWNPNDIYPVPQVQLAPYWPGDSYVDWVGITGYFSTTGPDTYTTLYAPTIREVRQFAHKPVLIAETSVETGPAEVTAVHNLVATVTGHTRVLGFIWFDYDKAGVDWRVESRPVLRAALARSVAGLQLVSTTK